MPFDIAGVMIPPTVEEKGLNHQPRPLTEVCRRMTKAHHSEIYMIWLR